MERESEQSRRAKDFLASEVVAQAAHDQIGLTAVERRLLLWSEIYNTGIDDETIAANDDPEEMTRYEKKISTLLKRARDSAKKNHTRDRQWKEALKTIEDEDHYIWVMLDQAGIKN